MKYDLKSTVARPSRKTGASVPTPGPKWNPGLPAPTNAADLPLTVQHQTFTHPIKSQGF